MHASGRICYGPGVPGDTTLPALSAAGLFGVAVFAFAGARRSGFAFTLALLTADLAGFGLAQAMESGDALDRWRLLDVSLSPWAPLLGLMLVLRFSGQLEQDRKRLRLAVGYFGLLSLLGVSAFFSTTTRAWVGSAGWPTAYLLGLLPSLGWACARLVTYARTVSASKERRRAWGILLGLLGAIPLGVTDLLADLDLPLPRLSVLAGPLIALVLASLALGADLFGPARRRVALGLALTGASLVLGAYALLRWLVPDAALPSLLVLVASLYALLFAGSYGFARLLERGERERLAYAGQMARQLMHDLNTPLGALRGATDYLLEERRRRDALVHDTEAEMFSILDAQIERLSGMAERYQRLLRLRCEPERVALEPLLARTLATLRAAFPRARFLLDAPASLSAEVDAALLMVALEKLLENAAEASEDGAAIHLRGRPMGRRICVEVEDSGQGMDPRQVAQALSGGASDKPGHWGLGLPFARRVCRLHGGELRIESRPEQGTRAILLLPAGRAAS